VFFFITNSINHTDSLGCFFCTIVLWKILHLRDNWSRLVVVISQKWENVHIHYTQGFKGLYPSIIVERGGRIVLNPKGERNYKKWAGMRYLILIIDRVDVDSMKNDATISNSSIPVYDPGLHIFISLFPSCTDWCLLRRITMSAPAYLQIFKICRRLGACWHCSCSCSSILRMLWCG
jgi:hypothetical protein